MQLSSLTTDKPVLISFTWVGCVYCKQMYPVLKEFSALYPNVQIVIISRGSPEENQDLMSEQEFPFPVLNHNAEVESAYIIPGTPFFYAIDKNGNVRNIGFANRLEDLERLTMSIREKI